MSSAISSEQPFADPRIPARDQCVLRHILDRLAAQTPERDFAWFENEDPWTYKRTQQEAQRTASGLQKLQIQRNDRVLVWLPNGPTLLRCWFGINYIGAVYVPVNTAYRGNLLEHVIRNSDAKVLIAHAELVDRLKSVDLANLETVVVVGGKEATEDLETLSVHGAEALGALGDIPEPLEQPIDPWDLQSIIYTSGTTGPSKGVLSSYLHLYTMTTSLNKMLTPDDRRLVNLPLFHAGGTSSIYGMLTKGGAIALVDSFKTDRFWDTIRRSGSTCVTLLGAMTSFLVKAPSHSDDRNHPLRTVIMVPLSEDVAVFTKRFGVDVYTAFNMTEISGQLVSERNPAKTGSCGKVRAGAEVRLVDTNDCEVPVNSVGELIVRDERPWGLNHGYNNNPIATAAAWRNGWFHTGDLFTRDESGTFFFVDRAKDAIRRRGENISSFEVENEVAAYTGVREAAAIGVPSPLGEDELLVVIAPVPGSSVDPAALIEFLIPRMAHFMIPRYVRIMKELPKTPTQKVQKHLLRQEGVTADTWDREQAGIRISRQKIRNLT
ncbi:MAG: ATP-dependent acyl-CoA ligase [Alphaproteobacteria bacterium]|nr:MAG: ATP-dependent acyl-CoA ligase [Alphaproteobacteria bacterium]